MNQLAGVIGKQWSRLKQIGIQPGREVTMILWEPAAGPRRYAEVSRAMPGVSAKMLTQTLRSLERDGFVARTVTPSVPVQVEYALTPLGDRIVPLIATMIDWANHHMDDVQEARAHYDATSA